MYIYKADLHNNKYRDVPHYNAFHFTLNRLSPTSFALRVQFIAEKVGAGQYCNHLASREGEGGSKCLFFPSSTLGHAAPRRAMKHGPHGRTFARDSAVAIDKR
jgi:hypothetical protein